MQITVDDKMFLNCNVVKGGLTSLRDSNARLLAIRLNLRGKEEVANNNFSSRAF